jgi:hypothetical protein
LSAGQIFLSERVTSEFFVSIFPQDFMRVENSLPNWNYVANITREVLILCNIWMMNFVSRDGDCFRFCIQVDFAIIALPFEFFIRVLS